jgi:hypothetical protein
LGALFAPTIVAGIRRHNNKLAIVTLNVSLLAVCALMLTLPRLLVGFVFFLVTAGWIVALAWAYTSNVRENLLGQSGEEIKDKSFGGDTDR